MCRKATMVGALSHQGETLVRAGNHHGAPAHDSRAPACQAPGDLGGQVPRRVAWWQDAEVPLFNILVHLLAETSRHAGHADILREGFDGAVGTDAGHGRASSRPNLLDRTPREDRDGHQVSQLTRIAHQECQILLAPRASRLAQRVPPWDCQRPWKADPISEHAGNRTSHTPLDVCVQNRTSPGCGKPATYARESSGGTSTPNTSRSLATFSTSSTPTAVIAGTPKLENCVLG